MAEFLAGRVRVSDLRGSASVPPSSAVLEDPTGRRRRRLRLGGRLFALTLTAWLIALVLGAVGLNPVPGVPFARVLRPASPPPAPKTVPEPVQPTVADLQPALPAGSPATAIAPSPTRPAAGAPVRRTVTKRGAASPRSVTVHTMPPAVDGAPGQATAPDQTTTHANNGKAPGSTTTTTETTTTTTTTPGRSGAAPGQAGATPGQSKTTTGATP